MANDNIGDKIKALRMQKGISQDRLSKLADLSLNTLTKIETHKQNNPRLETLRKIAHALGLSLSDLLQGGD